MTLSAPTGDAFAPTLVGTTAVLRQTSVSTMDNNAYLLTDESGRQLLVDPADSPDQLTALVAAGGTSLDLMVVTHSHWDHVRALGEMRRTTGARLLCGAADAAALPEPPDDVLEHGQTLTLGSTTVEVIALRGHTPGSVALAVTGQGGPTWLITGDSLFPGGPGKTATPEDFSSLMNDLETRVFDRYDDSTVVLPGHGAPTTLGTERPHLAEWRARGW